VFLGKGLSRRRGCSHERILAIGALARGSSVDPGRRGAPARALGDPLEGRGPGRDRLLRDIHPPVTCREVPALPRPGNGEGRPPLDGPRVAAPGRRQWTGRRPERAGRESARPGRALPRRTENAAEAEAVRGPDRGAGALGDVGGALALVTSPRDD